MHLFEDIDRKIAEVDQQRSQVQGHLYSLRKHIQDHTKAHGISEFFRLMEQRKQYQKRLEQLNEEYYELKCSRLRIQQEEQTDIDVFFSVNDGEMEQIIAKVNQSEEQVLNFINCLMEQFE